MEATMSLPEDKLTIRDSMKEAEDINKIKTACAAAGLDDTATAQLISKYGPYAEEIVKRNTAQAGENAGGFPSITYFLNNDLRSTEVGKLLNISPTEYDAKKQEWFITHPTAKTMESVAHNAMTARQTRLENQILEESEKSKYITWPPSDELLQTYVMPSMAMFEGVKKEAYPGKDKNGKLTGKYYIGLAQDTHYDDVEGSDKRKAVRVRPGDKIKSEEQYNTYFLNYVKERILPNIENNFPIDKLTKEELTAIIDISWQCGEGKLTSCKGFISNFNKYKETGDKKYLNTAVSTLQQSLSAQSNRNSMRFRLLKGEVTLGEAEGQLNPNAVQIEALRGKNVYSLSTEEFLKHAKRSVYGGKNYPDTIRTTFSPVAQTNVSTTARKVTQAKSR
jgi:hypothetical protein